MPVASVDYPGLRRSKRPAKMRDMTELQKGEPQISEKAIHELPAFHVSRSHSRPVRSTSVRKRWVFLVFCQFAATITSVFRDLSLTFPENLHGGMTLQAGRCSCITGISRDGLVF